MGCNDGCCPKVEEGASPAYVRVLWLVVLLNGGMFFVGAALSILGRSVSIRADVLDFLGDAAATGAGLLLVRRAKKTRAKASLVQGLLLGALGLFALGNAVWRAFGTTVPEPMSMGVYGVLGLAVNMGSALLLLKHRHGDSNVRAVWLYSRNDALGNVAVLVAAGLVAVLHNRWPDVLVGIGIAALFLHSAAEIIRHARTELQETTPAAESTLGA